MFRLVILILEMLFEWVRPSTTPRRPIRRFANRAGPQRLAGRTSPARPVGAKPAMGKLAAKPAVAKIPAPPGYSTDKDSVLCLARTLSGGDKQVLAEVHQCISDRTLYFNKFHGRYNNLATEEDAIPFFAALNALFARKYAGFIAHAADRNELKTVVDTLLKARGIRDFNWLFLKDADTSGETEAERNASVLNLVRDKLAEKSWVFFHIQVGWDNFDFALAKPDDFAAIRDLKSPDFQISDTFKTA